MPEITVTYDQRDKSFLIVEKGSGEMLWARNIVVAIELLKQQGFSDSQAREGVLRAVFNNGNAINMSHVEKYARLVSEEVDTAMQFSKVAEALYHLADSLLEKRSLDISKLREINQVVSKLSNLGVVWRKCPICSNYFAGTRDYGRCPHCGHEFKI